MKIKIKNRHGQLIDHDSDEPIPDQCGIVTNLMIMDSTQQAIANSRSTSRAMITDELGRVSGHRPGHAYLRDNDEAEARAQASYAESKTRLADSWRGLNVPYTLAAARSARPEAWHNMMHPSPQPDSRARNDAAIARESWKTKISSAWQTDAADNDAGSTDVESARAAYKKKISSAWKTGQCVEWEEPPRPVHNARPAHEAWPGPWVNQNPSVKPPDVRLDAADSADRAYEARNAMLREAWRTTGAPR